MFRNAILACTLAAVALTGCGRSVAPLAAGPVAGNASAKNILHFHMPDNHLLAAADLNGDFDHNLAMSTHEATKWDPAPKLDWAAHMPARPMENGAKSLPRTVYGYVAGIDSLVTMVAPETITFNQMPRLLMALFVGSLDTAHLVAEAQALTAARQTGKIKSDDPWVFLFRVHGWKDAVYAFTDDEGAAPTMGADGKVAPAPKKNTSVVVDAYTGQVVPSKVAAMDADTSSLALQPTLDSAK